MSQASVITLIAWCHAKAGFGFQVVPFSPAAGLLEWVEDTEPLGTYLTGKERTSGAHARYALPSDYSFFDAYNVITKCKPQNLRKAFDDVSKP